ncbi:MAG TPA: DUF5666 domain-containing protein [Armatimonadota bacterium]|nr:DUF5666 domain-containing protein [Armatimonadota bacterium]
MTRRSEKMSSRDIRVRDGYREWTVEVPKGTRITRDGEDISVHEIREGDTVRIQGDRDDDAHFRADRVVVESRYSDSPSSRYGDRSTISGSVRDIDYRAGTFRLRVNFFETYTVRLTRNTRILRDRHEVSLRELREDNHVQVQGDRDQSSNQIDAYRVEIQ